MRLVGGRLHANVRAVRVPVYAIGPRETTVDIAPPFDLVLAVRNWAETHCRGSDGGPDSTGLCLQA